MIQFGRCAEKTATVHDASPKQSHAFPKANGDLPLASGKALKGFLGKLIEGLTCHKLHVCDVDVSQGTEGQLLYHVPHVVLPVISASSVLLDLKTWCTQCPSLQWTHGFGYLKGPYAHSLIFFGCLCACAGMACSRRVPP
jgi:hypothetical protein